MIPSRFSFLPQFAFRLSICLLLTLFALTAVAQSGRRSGTGSPSVPPPEVKQPEKKPDPADQKRQEIILTANRGDVFAGIPLYLYDTVLKSCAGRLDDAHSVHVDVVSKHTSRSEAINTARAQKEAYVVWLQLRTDGVNNNAPGGDLSTISIDYTVYEPTTSKVKAQGTSYQGAYRGGGVVLSPRTIGNNNPAIAESRLKDAAQDAAERILKALHIALPSDMPTH